MKSIERSGYPLCYKNKSRDDEQQWVLVEAEDSQKAMFKWLHENPYKIYVGMITEKVEEKDLSKRVEKSNQLWNSFLIG